MHFVMSIWFVIEAMFLALVYLIVPVVVLLVLRRLTIRAKVWLKRKFGSDEKVPDWPPIHRYLFGKPGKFFAVVFLAYNIFLYGGQLTSRMGESGPIIARYYYAAGHVVYSYRRMLGIFFHPENKVLKPFNALQEKVFAKGSPFLPKDDGEIGVWTHQWFIYPYSRKMLLAKDAYWARPGESQTQINLLERLWFAIETVSTKPIASKLMDAKYLTGFPNMVIYYVKNNGQYSYDWNHIRDTLSSPKHENRGKKLVQWIEKVRKRWLKGEVFGASVPSKQKMLLDTADVLVHSDVLVAQILNRKFSCEYPYIYSYLNARQAIMAAKINSVEMERLKKVCISTGTARFHKYILEKYCGIKVPGKDDNSHFAKTVAKHGKQTADEIDNETMMSDFRKEFKILKELGYE